MHIQSTLKRHLGTIKSLLFSRASRASLQGKFKKPVMQCHWAHSTMVINCDGRVSCGCADPLVKRPVANVHECSSLYEAWNSSTFQSIREGLNSGFSPICNKCRLYQDVGTKENIVHRSTVKELSELAKIFIEPTIRCNLACLQEVCCDKSIIYNTRSHAYFDFGKFKEIVDEAGPTLRELILFNYGEPFLHPQIVDFIEYVKSAQPHVFVFLSTNGIPLDEKKIERIVAAGLDMITFSIDGPDQETYEKYRVKGDFGKAYGNMKQLADEKKRQNKHLPRILWRYILFKWNDSELQLKKAMDLAETSGIDQFCWEPTFVPPDGYSRRYNWNSPQIEEIRKDCWEHSQLANTIVGKRYLASISPSKKHVRIARGEGVSMEVFVENTGGAAFLHESSSPLATVRLGVQLCDASRNVMEQDFCSAPLTETLLLNDAAAIPIEITAAVEPGEYQLKFDMYMTRDQQWFEKVGSRPAFVELEVV